MLSLVLMASMVVGQADGAATFRSFSEFIVGGTWTATVGNATLEHSYCRTLNDKFVQVTLKGGANTGIALFGIDPETKQCTEWVFGEDGNVGKWVCTQEAEGVWMLDGRTLGPGGEFKLKTRVTRVDANTLKNEMLEFTVKGLKQPAQTATWIRKR